MPEIDEIEGDELSKLTNLVLNNEETRKEQIRLFKKVRPDLVAPELQTEAEIAAATKPLKDQIAALTKKDEQSEAARRLEERRKPFKERGMTDEQIVAEEKAMLEAGVVNANTWLTYKDRNEQLATPTSGGTHRSGMTFDESVVTKEFFKDPQKEARKVADAFFNERSTRRRAG